jgi:hypothetical protein
VRVVAPILGLAGSVAVGLAVWGFSPAPQTVEVVQPVDYELTADCLAEHQSWRNFNSTLADLERDLRFCIEVWPTAQLSAP